MMTRAEALAELKLAGTPTGDDVKAAYRARAKVTHPDATTGSELAFHRTRTARDVLKGKIPPAVVTAEKPNPPKPAPVDDPDSYWVGIAHLRPTVFIGRGRR